jgi:archaellum component FlaF (FlaF/FlaG flagellin family)
MPATTNYHLYKAPDARSLWKALDLIDAKLKTLDDGIGGEAVVADVATLKTEVETASTGLLDRVTATEAGSAGVKITKISVPADGTLSANQAVLYFDPTNGAAAIKIKAKQADGTVKTATIAVTT